MPFVYRVVSWRAGNSRPVIREFKSLRHAERRFTLLTSPEPWVAFGNGADDLKCCDGYGCSCEGSTVRESFLARRALLPRLLKATFERRRVEAWETVKQSDGVEVKN